MIYEILKDGKVINTIVADEEFCKEYCAENGYTYAKCVNAEPAPEPTEVEQLRADVDFIAMETGVDL